MPARDGASAARVFSAPGKLVLIGEYAVVDGFPAVVAAVSRRALVTVEVAGAAVPRGADAALEVRGNGPRWVRGGDITREQPLLGAVLAELAARGITVQPARVTVSSAAFTSEGKKLGLGSSAAACVAFTSVFVHTLGTDAVHDVARAAHRAFQGGGSGIDVAASTYGGMLKFQEGRASPAPALPPDLDVVVAWTGVSAKTQGFIDAWRALPDRLDHARAIDSATLRFLTGSARGDASEVLRAVADARLAMHAMGAAAGVDVVTAAHLAIAAIARAHGGEAKPSGAGGGDVAVCFVPRDRRDALARALASGGFDVVDLKVGEPGVRRD